MAEAGIGARLGFMPQPGPLFVGMLQRVITKRPYTPKTKREKPPRRGRWWKQRCFPPPPTHLSHRRSLMSTCPNCGGSLLGDGTTTPFHCERLSASDLCAEPDANPIYCDPEPHGSRDTLVPAPMNPEHRHQLRLALIGMRTAISMLLYTPETAGWLLEDKNSHHAGGVMDHLEALADSLCIVHGDVF